MITFSKIRSVALITSLVLSALCPAAPQAMMGESISSAVDVAEPTYRAAAIQRVVQTFEARRVQLNYDTTTRDMANFIRRNEDYLLRCVRETVLRAFEGVEPSEVQGIFDTEVWAPMERQLNENTSQKMDAVRTYLRTPLARAGDAESQRIAKLYNEQWNALNFKKGILTIYAPFIQEALSSDLRVAQREE